MDGLPRLKVTGLNWNAVEEVVAFKQAQYFPFGSNLIISVEDQVINSFDDLLRLVEREPYRDMEYLKVVFLPVVVGG